MTLVQPFMRGRASMQTNDLPYKKDIIILTWIELALMASQASLSWKKEKAKTYTHAVPSTLTDVNESEVEVQQGVIDFMDLTDLTRSYDHK